MSDLMPSRKCSRKILTLCGAAFISLAALGCGVQEHGATPKARSETGGEGTGLLPIGTGGAQQVAASGGQPAGTGGQPGGLGGSGPQPTPGTGGGGQVGGTGGNSGTGGRSATGGAPALSGAGIMINGTFVPKEKAIVFIHFGHSNMRGMAVNPASLHSFFYDTQPNLWTYQANGTFALAKEPTAPEGNITLAGPGTALLKIASAAAAPNGGYQFISIGRGISSDTTVDYLPSGLVYPSFITSRAVSLKGKVTFGAVFVMLGITERHLPTAMQPGYPGRVQQIIAAIRADLGEPNLPVLYCDYEQNALGTLAPTGSVGVVILPLTRMLPGLISNLVLVPTDMIPRADYEDDHHFNLTGHQIWATQAIDLMKSKGWFPWQ